VHNAHLASAPTEHQYNFHTYTPALFT